MSEPCRRCGGAEHFAREVPATDGTFNLLPIGFWKPAKFEVRVCGTCGLIEWSVPERFLPRVRDKFTPVA